MYKYYLYTTRLRTSLPATEKRQSCIYRVGKRRLPDPSCKSSRPNKNSASRGPLSLSPLLRSPCPSGERASYDQQRRETKGRSQGKRGFCSTLPRLPASPVSFSLAGGTGRGPRFDVWQNKRLSTELVNTVEGFLFPRKYPSSSHPSWGTPFSVPLSCHPAPSPALSFILPFTPSFQMDVCTYIHARTYVRYRLPLRVYGIREWIERGDHDLAASTNGYVRVRGSNAYKLLKIGPLFKLVSRFDTDRIPTSYRRLQDISPGRSFPTIPRLYRSLTGVLSFLLRLDYRSENATIFRQFALFLPMEDLCSRFLPFAKSFRWSSANWNVEEYRLRRD